MTEGWPYPEQELAAYLAELEVRDHEEWLDYLRECDEEDQWAEREAQLAAEGPNGGGDDG